MVFASGTHLAAPATMLEGVHSALAPRALAGCGAGGVLGAGRELESGTALAVWAASFGGAGEATTWHATASEESGEAGPERPPVLEGLPGLDAAAGAIVLSDPYSFPTEVALAELAAQAPAVPVLGGVSSARTEEGRAALFFGEETCEQGAVGVVLRGIEMLPCVSQGAAPLGRELTITSAEGNVIHQLAGRPALEVLERTIGELSARERVLVTAGLLIGIVIDSGKPEYEQGDFLVRGILGADRESGSLAVAAAVHEGQVVRLHARDRFSADEDLRRALRLRVQALGGDRTAGALVFSCNGRGRAMFGAPDHDATAIEDELGRAPAAGFFAAGEIGPVGGRSFLHGFTATVAVFAG
ncbi:MAG: histidine kinase [Solirubrobacterales bacterium]|nr:MAG: histidine kinase [Solirubrobacterales bacterium]